MAKSYSKQEFFSVVFFYVSGSSMILIVLSSNIFFEVNELRLPVNFHLTILPFTGFSISWALNYVFQVIMIVNASCFLYIYIPLTMIVLNHSCWQLDETLFLLAKLSKTLAQDPESSVCKKQVRENMKDIVKMGSLVLEWQSDVQSLIGFNFLTEFSLLSSIIALCLFSMSSNFFDSTFILCVFSITMVQLFFYCFMGNRVITRIDSIVAVSYDLNWYSIELPQRKGIITIIQMAQNMKGFNGIFWSLSMETFKMV